MGNNSIKQAVNVPAAGEKYDEIHSLIIIIIIIISFIFLVISNIESRNEQNKFGTKVHCLGFFLLMPL